MTTDLGQKPEGSPAGLRNRFTRNAPTGMWFRLLGALSSISVAGLLAAAEEASAPSSKPFGLPETLQLGPFDLVPRVSAGVVYDDNILSSTVNEKSDFIWSLQPGLFAVAGDKQAVAESRRTYYQASNFTPETFIATDQAEWPGPTLTLDYAPTFNWFTKYDENNSVDQLLNANGLWSSGPLMLGAQQGYFLQRTTVIEAGRRAWQEKIPTVIMGGYQFSDKTAAEVNLRRTSMDYEDSPGLTDYTDWSNDDWFFYRLSPRLNLGLGATFGLLDVASQDDQTYETILARARYRYFEKVLLDFSAGAQIRQYEAGASQSVEPVFTLTTYYEPRDTTAVSLTAFRREVASVTTGFNYLMTGLSLGAEQRIRERYYLKLGLAYYNADYRATTEIPRNFRTATRTDNFVEVKPGFEVRFTRNLTGNIFYLYRTLQSREQNTWDDNQAGAQVTWTY